MKKFVILTLFAFSLFAIDWSERSTKELIAALASAKGAQAAVILHELKKREPLMNAKEKQAYIKALKKSENGR
jgi:hypothetical protein